MFIVDYFSNYFKENRKEKILKITLFLVIIAGCWLRIDNVFSLNPRDQLFSDPERHWITGKEPLLIRPFAIIDPIFYQTYMGALLKWSVGLPLIIAFYTSLLSIIMPWCWYRFLRELLQSKMLALSGWAIIAWLPSWLGIYSYFMQETLMLPLLGISLYLTWRCKRKKMLGPFLVMVLFWAITGLTRGIIIPSAGIACFYLWITQDQKLEKAIYSTLILSFILGPLAYRSYKIMGLVSPHGIAYINQIYAASGKAAYDMNITYNNGQGNNGYFFQSPSTTRSAKPLAPLSDWQSKREGKVWIRVDSRNGAQDWRNELTQESVSFTEKFYWRYENLVFLFFGESWPDSKKSITIQRVSYHMRWVWFPLTLFAIVMIVLYRKALSKQYLLSWMIVCWFVFQGLLLFVPVEGRYRKPYEGLLICQILLIADRRKTFKPSIDDPPDEPS